MGRGGGEVSERKTRTGGRERERCGSETDLDTLVVQATKKMKRVSERPKRVSDATQKALAVECKE